MRKFFIALIVLGVALCFAFVGCMFASIWLEDGNGEKWVFTALIAAVLGLGMVAMCLAWLNNHE